MLATTILQEMTYTEIEEYIQASKREYAQGMLDQGEYADYDAAFRASANEINYYYSHTGENETHYAYHLINAHTQQHVGVFVYSVLSRKSSPEPFVFIDYISVYPQFRRAGHARFAILWVEKWAREHHMPRIDLNVMQHKKGAVKLYESLGYEIYQQRKLGFAKEPSRYDMRKYL